MKTREEDRAESVSAGLARRRLAALTLRHRRRLAVALYAAVALAPLALALVGPAPPARRFGVELASALGLVAFMVLGLQLVLPGRLRRVAGLLGVDTLVRFHRTVAGLGLALVLAHVAVVVLDEPARIALLDPLHAPWRAQAGLGALVALLVLVFTSAGVGRRLLRYGRWRAAHLGLGGLVVAGSLLHMVGVGHYLARPLLGAPLLALGIGGLAWVAHVRVLQPLRAARPRYRVERVVAERGGAHTLVLQPDGHDGRAFRPGQFAWLRARTRRGLEDHPFSFSSSAERPDRPEFTIKAAGDFTSTVAGLAPGTPVLLDGPYGALHPSERSLGLVLVVGGIGITPALSILRTLADRADPRPHLLFYANWTWGAVTFREEVEALTDHLDLRVVHVLAHPPEGWSGERGLLDAGVLRRHLSPDVDRRQFVVCGPPPMVSAAVAALSALGVPPGRVQVEAFAPLTGRGRLRYDAATRAALAVSALLVLAPVAFAVLRGG